jgi:hypothetical protein
MRLVDARRRADGALVGGHVVLAANRDIPTFSDEQYYGNGRRPRSDEHWKAGSFTLNGSTLDYYDYVRARLAGGTLAFDPVQELRDMVNSNCNDLHYRADAVSLAIAAGSSRAPEPDRLPANIFGTDGDWETYSTPSRDARLKTAFRQLREQTQRFVELYRAHDRRIVYDGKDLVGDLIAGYDEEAAACRITYQRSDGSDVTISYEDARRRLFQMSFDPYHCAERRWGATDPQELSTCPDGVRKAAWYAAEQRLRNQIDRTYDARMDYTIDDLRTPGASIGADAPPDIDVRAWLVAVRDSAAVSMLPPG